MPVIQTAIQVAVVVTRESLGQKDGYKYHLRLGIEVLMYEKAPPQDSCCNYRWDCLHSLNYACGGCFSYTSTSIPSRSYNGTYFLSFCPSLLSMTRIKTTAFNIGVNTPS